MYVQSFFRDAAFLASIAITLQGFQALLIPIRAIIAICSALPAMMIWSTVSRPKAITTTKPIFTINPGQAGKGLATMLTDKLGFLSNVKTSFFSYALALTLFRAKALLGMCIPIGAIWADERLSTKCTDNLNALAHTTANFIHAITRAICTFPAWSMLEMLSANWAHAHDSGDASFSSGPYVSTFRRTVQVVGSSIGVRASGIAFAADRANRHYQLWLQLSAVMGIAALNRAKAAFLGGGELFTTDRANRVHCHTSGSTSRVISGGAFPGMNARQRVASPL